MLFEWILLAAVAAWGLCTLLLEREQKKLRKRLDAAEDGLARVKQAAEDYPRICNEIKDIRDTLDELPVDDMRAQAEYEKAYLDALESLSNYSVDVAMKGGGGLG